MGWLGLGKTRRPPPCATTGPAVVTLAHDLRRTVATCLVDLGFSYEVVAAVLGHEAGSKEVRTLVRHYVRTDLVERKRQALLAWDVRLYQILSGETSPANIVPLAPIAAA